VTGSATLKGGKITSVKTTCTLSGKKYDLTLTGSTDATYASPSGKSLTAHTSLTGNLTAPASSKTGAYEVSSIKLA
jgi:hypothetical protein